MIKNVPCRLLFVLILASCAGSSKNSKTAISENTADANSITQPVITTESIPLPLNDLPQSEYGGFVLKPGFYEGEFKTYCLQPGTPDPREGDAYLQSAVTGYRKEIVSSVLVNSRGKQDIDQRNIQLLLWSVVSRADYNKLPHYVQADAMRLLTPKQVFELKGGVVGMVKNISKATGLLNANNDINKLFESSIQSYEAFEQVAVRREQSKVVKKGIKYDQWYKQDENYYVRYFPASYKKVKIQVYVPDSLLDADNKLNGEYVVFDPTGKQAMPAFTNAQRLGIGAPVIDILRVIIKTNRPPAIPKKIPGNKNPKSQV